MKGNIKMIYQRWNIKYEVVDLTEYGIYAVAFDLPSVVSYMYEAASNGLLILGGDIIFNEDGIYTESPDNWYSEKKTPMGTLQDALDYLSRYWKYRCTKESDCPYWKNDKGEEFPWCVTVVLKEPESN